ncbi:hypothetical protein VTK73DRAFT_2601 [Phialemonium thermophilum]|uniref:Inositol-pentakisphosphate 2-kinase n=1 Tax=Phialemonium thermophilum TaxID=223376 RepID=A0ABR3X3Q7_9PEZI
MKRPIPSLPRGCEAHFVGEGAANAVFKLSAPNMSASEQALVEGKLLRVPKAGTKAYPYEELQRYWEEALRPLFGPDDLVDQSLICLRGSGIALELNALLAETEPQRRADFRGSRVADVEAGMLVDEMCKLHPGDIVLEFKPKWLVQSPSAPTSSMRCRTCALRAYRAATGRGQHKGASAGSDFCPLDLAECHRDPTALCRVLDALTKRARGLSRRQVDQLADWLRTNGLLARLRSAQMCDDLALAMTLRDCTCFLRIPSDDTRGLVEARLGDLDKKNAEAKLGYWQAVEQTLIEGGYYEGRENPRQLTCCRLERGR